MMALTLSDGFVVDRHRAGLLAFIESQVDLVFANEVEICSLFQTDDFEAAIEAIAPRAKLAAVTRGGRARWSLAKGEAYAVTA